MIRLRAPLLALAVAGAGALSACGGNPQVSNDTCTDAPPAAGQSAYYPEPDTNGTPVGQQIPQMPHSHVNPPTKVHYEHNPPTSGCHYNLGFGVAPVAPGVYASHIDPEYWVHNLEHGYIVVVYNCGDGTSPASCPDDFTKLRQWYQRQGADPGLSQAVGQQAYAKTIVIPWSFDHKFAAISWDWYDTFDTLDTSPTGELQKFYDNHVSHSPEGLGSQ